MFKSLFKSGWKSDSVEKRLAFIADVDVTLEANQTILETLAANDTETSVCHAAIAKMTKPQALFDLLQLYNYMNRSESAQFAENALRSVMQSGDLTESEFKTFLNKTPESNLIIAKYCPLEDIRKEVLLALDETEQASIISEIAYSNTRLMLAENIQSINALEVVRKNLKGKDKNAEKVIRAKIDVFHAQQKQAQDNADLVISIREGMQALARYVAWSDEIRVKFEKLTKQWNALDFAPEAQEKALYQQAFEKVDADVKQHMDVALSQQNQQKITNKLESICAKIADYPLDKLLTESPAINEEYSDLSQQWEKEKNTVPATTPILDRFRIANKSLQSALAISQCVTDSRLIQKDVQDTADANNDKSFMVNHHAKAILQATKTFRWPKDYPQFTAKNAAIDEANAILNASKTARQEQKDALDKLHKRISRIFAAAQRGEISRAQRELEAATKQTNNYAGNERKKLDERIEEATQTVSKMGDWKDFAIEPKLIDLCEKMESLPELEKRSKNPSADNLAKKIKDLQQQWKAMGSSDISDIHWPRFKTAGDIAYEPCAEFFKKKKEIQRNNLAKRDPFIEQMKDLLESTDWEAKPDYKAVEDQISQIMQDWKKIKDVEHGRGQKQWDKLSTYKDQINQKLDVEYDKNIKAKESLIEQLEQMIELEVNEKNSEQTLDKLKFTQTKWKQIGVTRRKQDQKAWNKFKIASDAVYAKIQGVRQEKRAVEDEQIDAYKAIHKQIHQLAKTTKDLSVSDKEFEALDAQYKELPSLPSHLPEKLIERLGIDYSRACEAYAGAKDRLNQAKLDNELDTLATKAQLCAELEQLPEKADATVIAELEEKINSLEISNKNYIKRFGKRLKKAREPDRKAYGEARRLLLIDCEILLDKESPKEDKDLRLQIQLDRMKSQGIGNVAVNKTAELAEMKLEWLCLPGADAKLQTVFDQRFDALFKK